MNKYLWFLTPHNSLFWGEVHLLIQNNGLNDFSSQNIGNTSRFLLLIHKIIRAISLLHPKKNHITLFFIFLNIKYFFIQKHYSRGVWTPKNEIYIYIYLYIHTYVAAFNSTYVWRICDADRWICLHLLWHLFAFVVAFVCICLHLLLHLFALLWDFFAFVVAFVFVCSSMFYIYVCECTGTNRKCWNRCKRICNKCNCICKYICK